jgi:hypothetical protein
MLQDVLPGEESSYYSVMQSIASVMERSPHGAAMTVILLWQNL